MRMIDRPKLLLLIPHLGRGGAERVSALLAQHLSREKYELHLALVTQAATAVPPFPPGVTVHFLGATRVRFAAFRVLSLVRRLRPCLILSGMFHLNFLVLLLRPMFPPATCVLVRQNGTLSTSLASDHLPFFTRLFYRWLYPRADQVVCQSAAMAEDLARQLAISTTRLPVLRNPVDVEAIRDETANSPSLWTGSGPHLLAIGRLSREKGFDLLLQALAAVREQLPSADLVIAGAGPEEAALRDQCRNLGLESAVHFAGRTAQPAKYFPGASAFVLPSRHEGMPNALLEAAAAGLPLVALPASGGVVELLRGQPGTWLAHEISSPALASTLLAALRELQPAQRFIHPFIDEFRIDRALRAYENLIDRALRQRLP
jgi:glycosyltransferase involved in cell wall biosynthesis